MLNNPHTIKAPRDGGVNNVAVTDSSSAAQNLNVGGGLVWVRFFFVAKAEEVVYLNFDNSSSVANATVTDCPIPALQYVDYQVDKNTSFFKAIGSASGTLIWFKPGS